MITIGRGLKRRVVKQRGVKQRACKQSGFTLIEVIVFIVVMALAFTTVMQVYQRAVINSADPLIMLRAKTLARSTLDTLLSREYDELERFHGRSPTVIRTVGQYQVLAEVVLAGASFNLPKDALQRVTVTVKMSGEHSLSLTGYKAEYPWKYP